MTVALGTNIANPISTALSKWLGFDTMGKLANYGKLGVTDPDAVIKALFANSEQGAWYDPSDLTTMFQDRAGTTPVTADGQTVGKILDKSGRSNHATAPNDAARPLYKTDGTYHWLQYDGVDDELQSSAVNLTGTDKISIFTGAQGLLSLSYTNIIGNGNVNSTSGSFALFIPSNVNSIGMLARATSTATKHSAISAGKRVIAATVDFAAASNSVCGIAIDGGAFAYAGVSGTGAFANLPLTVGGGSAVGGATSFNGNQYAIILLSRLAATQEITDTETWVNSKTGAY